MGFILFGNAELSHSLSDKIMVRPVSAPAGCGFTLIELMVTLAVASILLGLAVPGFGSLTKNVRISNQANEFMAALTFARSEASKRGAATLCPSTSGLACSGGTTWHDGWIVFHDANANGVVNSGESVLHVHAALSGGNTLKSGARIRVTYRGDGYPHGFNDSFRLCDSRGAELARTIVLSNQGRVRIVRGASLCP